MKKGFILFLLTVLSFGSYAQEMKKTEATFNDYLPLLQESGYNTFCYDISEYKDSTYNISFIIREYAGGEHLKDKDRRIGLGTNRIMLDEFDEETRAKVIADGIAEDAGKGIFRLATNIQIGFTPTTNDSVQNIMFRSYGKEPLVQSRHSVTLHDVRVDQSRGFIKYRLREFEEEPMKCDTFIPLLMYASFWWDAKHNIYRFCGDSELTRDVSSSLFKDSPHYYIIGVEIGKAGASK